MTIKGPVGALLLLIAIFSDKTLRRLIRYASASTT
jgi:hypothetical protein